MSSLQSAPRTATKIERPRHTDGAADFPVFVVGAPRSGTTLLYSILLSSGAFPIYEAESRIMECESKYGDLRNRRNFERLLDDYLEARQFHRSGLDPESFRRDALSRCSSYPDFLRFFMESMAASQEKIRWVEKTPNHVFHMRELAESFPSARFVHVIRDGRSVALSARAAGHVERFDRDAVGQLVWAGRIWEMMVLHGRRRGEELPGRYLEVRYEEIVRDLDGVLERLRRFVEVPLTRSGVESSRVGSLGSANTSFEQDMTGISGRSMDRWKQRLDGREIEILHWMLGDALRELGYEVQDEEPETATVSLGGMLRSKLSYWALRTRKLLNRRTPVGRLGRKPLEIGLR